MIYPAKHKQLFLDDDAIESMYGLKRTLNKPEKVGPVIRTDQSKGQVALETADPPQWNSEKGLWEWWYGGGYEVRPHGRWLTMHWDLTHYATSTDGVNWDRPNLGLYEWRGSKDNNIAVDPQGMSMTQMLRDERDVDPDRRYKALFTAAQHSGRYPAVSPDGFDWTMIDVPPIPSEDTSYLTYDETTKQFLATVKIGTEWGRSVWLSTSPDFLTWTDPVLIFHSDEIDRNNGGRRVREVVADPAYLSPPFVDDENHIAQIYKMPITPYEGIYIGFPVVFNPAGALPEPWGNFTALNQVEVSMSRDLYNWKRVANRDVFIGVEPWDGVNYGTTQLLTCGRFHVHEDREIWVYYSALRFRAPPHFYDERYQKYMKDNSALCLAKVRLDGFVSLDAEKRGTLVSKPFRLEGGDVCVNVDAGGGELRAELLDAETLEPLAGLSSDDCEPVRGDHLRARVTWKGGADLGDERAVRLRLIADHARLYAFWLEG